MTPAAPPASGPQEAATPGQAAYEAYAAASAGKSLVSGQQLPTWHEQAPQIREAWQAAAGAVMLMAQAAVDYAELASLREEVSHLSAALAGDNEGVRLWMLDCGALVDKHRQERDAAREKLAALRAEAEAAASSLILEAANARSHHRRELGTRLDGLARRLVNAASARAALAGDAP